jgi:hypothetical protein
METQLEEIVKLVMNVKEITKEELYEANKEYNPAEWKKTLDRFDKYKDVKFYIAEKQGGYDYDRYFSVYTIPEGITFFSSVSYSSCLSNSGFVRIGISEKLEVRRFLLNGSNGEYGRFSNIKSNRLIMAKTSKDHGLIFSNEF